MTDIILQDTTLAAIVRDEEDNPAYGVEVWLRATLPYVERAVVVDTGSIDRTREILEMLKKDFSNLEVYDRVFDDFASSRNFSLEKVKTKRALILDADELLLPEEFHRLNKYVIHEERPAVGYLFIFKQIYPDGSILHTQWDKMTTRLFDVEGASFSNGRENGIYEGIELPEHKCLPIIPPRIAIIKHFLPNREAEDKKLSLWYNADQIHQVPPLEHAKIHGWKEQNGGRNFYFSPESVLKEHFPRMVGGD